MAYGQMTTHPKHGRKAFGWSKTNRQRISHPQEIALAFDKRTNII
jgi:hypothetical protein